MRRIACLLFFALAPAFAIDDAALRAEIDARASTERFSGAVLVARHGTVSFSSAVGFADRDARTPATLETKFRFGSLGKMFTAVAIAQLEEAGKLSFDDPLGKFLPDYPNRDVAKVTIHQLLTHTGGTGDVFGPDFMQRRAELRDLRDYVRVFGERAPEFPPGSRHEYSNYGYILLGRVIESVSGQPYDRYVRERVFVPAGMTSTGNEPEETHVASLAVPYSRGPAGGPLRSAEDTLPYRGTSAGGGYTTAGDLLKFAAALESHRLLGAAQTQRMLAGKVDTPFPGLKYAYGFEDVRLPDGRRRIGHGGGAPGMNAVLSIYPDTGDVVVVLANLDPPAAIEVDRLIGRALSPH